MTEAKKYFVNIEETEKGLSIKSNAPTPVVLEMLNMTQSQVTKDFIAHVETILTEQEEKATEPEVLH